MVKVALYCCSGVMVLGGSMLFAMTSHNADSGLSFILGGVVSAGGSLAALVSGHK